MLFVKPRTRRVTHIYYTPSGTIEIFCFHGSTRRPIPSHPLLDDARQVATEIGSPDPSKSRRPGLRRAFTRRTRFQAAITAPKEANQTLRTCSQFHAGRKYRVRLPLVIVLFLIFPAITAYQAREQGVFRGTIHPCLHPARRRERYGAVGTCVLLLLLLPYIAPAAAATAAPTAASTAATAEKVC